MKKKILSMVLAVAFVIGAVPVAIFAVDGDANDIAAASVTTNGNWLDAADDSWYNDSDLEFTVTTAEQLAGFAKLVNEGNKFVGKTITLGNDIDLAGKDWSPIGGGEIYFAGEFDGNANSILNLTDTRDVNRKGLFGLVEKCYIHDLTLANVYFSGNASGMRVGALAGNLQYYNVIENVVVTGLTYDLSDTDGLIGGLAGYSWTSYVKNCEVKDSVMNITSTADSYVGAVISYGRGVNDPITNFPYSNKIAVEDCITEGDDAGSLYNCVDCKSTNVTVNASGTVTVGGFIGGDTYNSWRNVSKNCAVSGLVVDCAAGDGIYTVGGYMGGQFGGLRDSFVGCTAEGTITSAGSNENSIFGGFLGYKGGRGSDVTNASANVNIDVVAGDVGGFVGEVQMYRYEGSHQNEYSFDNCVANGDVSTGNGTAGGFAGGLNVAEGNGGLYIEVSNSSANGSVAGTTAGGFIGTVDDSMNGSNYGGTLNVTNSSATQGEVKGETVYAFMGTASDAVVIVPALNEVVETPTDSMIAVLDGTFTVTTDKSSYNYGDTITVTVTMNGYQLSAGKWSLTYDQAIFEYIGSKSVSDGKIEDDFVASDYIANDAVLSTYTFKVIGNLSECTNVEFGAVDVDFWNYDGAANETSINTTVVPAAVEVKDGYVVNVNIGDDTTSDYVAGKKLVLVYTNNETLTYKYNGKDMYDVTAKYNLANAIEEDVKTYTRVFAIVADAIENGAEADYEALIVATEGEVSEGCIIEAGYDINGSGEFTLRDISVVFGVYNGLGSYEDDHMDMVLRADINGDMRVDAEDAEIIVNAFNSVE